MHGCAAKSKTEKKNLVNQVGIEVLLSSLGKLWYSLSKLYNQHLSERCQPQTEKGTTSINCHCLGVFCCYALAIHIGRNRNFQTMHNSVEKSGEDSESWGNSTTWVRFVLETSVFENSSTV